MDPQLRASDADRERVAIFLRDQAAVGRLTSDELEERVGAAYRAVTVGDLERLIRDLPRARPPRPAVRLAAPVRRRRPGAIVPLGILALLVLGAPGLLWVAGLALALGAAAVIAVLALGFALGPFILIGFLIALAIRRRRPPRRRIRFDPLH